MRPLLLFFAFTFLAICSSNDVLAQGAKLSIQGILKKADGQAVDDGNYNLTFKLYSVETGGTALWTETQSDIEVTSGVYTAILGSTTALNVPFNQTYYLGVSVNNTAEMAPRIQLTTAPYALALIGNTNQFPSSGLVKADNQVIAGKLGVNQAAVATTASVQVTGGMLARAGAPGADGASNNGYGFTGATSGNNDSGIYSPSENQVSVYANNSELLRISNPAPGNNTSVNIKTNALIDNSLTVADQLIVNGRVSDLTFNDDKGIKYYNGATTFNDWRLVDRDDFDGSFNDQGWDATTTLVGTTDAAVEVVDYGDFNGYVMRVAGSSNTPVLKKQFNLSGAGTFSQIKVVMKYYMTDSWDPDDLAFAGFAADENATDPVICWQYVSGTYSNVSNTASSYTGTTNWSDAATTAVLVGQPNNSTFWVFAGMRSDEGTGNERFAISNVEVWVR